MPRHPHNRFTKEWMTMHDKATGATRHQVVIPPGSVIKAGRVDDSAPEVSRHTRDVVIERPAPYHDRVIVTVRVDDAPSLAAAFAGRQVPPAELGTPMPPVVPATLYVVTLPYTTHDAEGGYLTRDAAVQAARGAIRELTASVILEHHDTHFDQTSLVAGTFVARVDPMPVHDGAPAHGLPVVGLGDVLAAVDAPGLPVDVMHASADGPAVQAHYAYGEDDHSDAEPGGLDDIGADDLDPDDCAAEFIDGRWSYCPCPECQQRKDDDRESAVEYGVNEDGSAR